MLIELQSAQLERRIQRYADALLTQMNPPLSGSAPFHFVLQTTVGVYHRRIEAVNRLMYLVPNTGLAALHRFVKLEVIGAEYPAEVRTRLQKRETDHDRVKVAYQLKITAATDESRNLAVDAIADFLLSFIEYL